jgi:hypothetical protein
VDGESYTSDQATIWRWRTAFQNDFAARMDWTIKKRGDANHNPDVVVNGHDGKAPVELDATAGVPLTLDAANSRDPDGHSLKYTWVFYPEAGTGIPGRSVYASGRPPTDAVRTEDGQISSAPEGGPREPPARVEIGTAAATRVTVTPRIAGTAHIILAVEDDGSPPLTSYRRVILTIREAAQ